uniref:CRAL-TRIO domain-containing protein n=1 Tax=Steinernema glaseri TaxID=37863 RepID=A0A1I7YHA2_9BILA
MEQRNARRSLLSAFERSTLDRSALNRSALNRSAILTSPGSEVEQDSSASWPASKDPIAWITSVTRVLGSMYLYHRNIFPQCIFQSTNMERDGIENLPVLHEAQWYTRATDFIKIMDALPELLRGQKVSELSFVVAPENATSDFADEKFKVSYMYYDDRVDAVVDLGGKRRISTMGMSAETFQGLTLNFGYMLKSLDRIPGNRILHITACIFDDKDMSKDAREKFMKTCGFSFAKDPIDELKTPALVLDRWGNMGDTGEVTMDIKVGSVFNSAPEHCSTLTESFDDLRKNY